MIKLCILSCDSWKKWLLLLNGMKFIRTRITSVGKKIPLLVVTTLWFEASKREHVEQMLLQNNCTLFNRRADFISEYTL